MLPVLGAIGGMLLPAIIHFGLNHGKISQNGFGIPIATDIAFTLVILSLLGNRVPLSLKIFLTAFAIIDDLRAIIIIAMFYSKNLSLLYLGLTFLVFFIMFTLGRLKVYNTSIYLVAGIAMWFFM